MHVSRSLSLRLGLGQALFVLTTTMIAWALVYSPLVQAQSDEITWSAPIQLSEESEISVVSYPPYPTVVADPWGGVHVFWVPGNELVSKTGEGPSNMIYYVHWDGQTWSKPHDVIIGSDVASYDFLYAAVDATGTLHLLWASGDGLYYSSAACFNADDAKAWQPPQVLVQGRVVAQSRLVVDRKGILHVVYCQREPGTNVMYLRSEDRGWSWSAPTPISELVPDDPQTPTLVRMAIDSHGRLHVVWAESHPPEWLGRHVFYTRSNEDGTTWTRPLDLSDLSLADDWDSMIDLAVDTQDRIHAVWVCGISPGRCYRYSTDGGDSWSDIRRLFGHLIGVGAWDTMAADPYGNVYWVGMLRYPQGFYFSAHANNRWNDPPQLLLDRPTWGVLSEAHYPQLVVGQGNQLHVVMVEGMYGAAIWYMRGQSSQPAVQPPPTPTAPPALTSTPIWPTSTPRSRPASQVREFEELPSSPAGRFSSDRIAWGLAPVLLLLLFVILVNYMRFRR